MASGIAETAKLIVSLTLKDDLSKGVASASRSLGGLEARVGRIGKIAGQGMKTAAANLAKIGAVAAIGLAGVIKSGIGYLAELEDANSATAAALKASGLAASVSTEQIRAWSEELEIAVGRASDDKAFQRAANTLIRFGNLTGDELKKAMLVAADLSASMVKGGIEGGTSPEQAAQRLARALADPTKATGVLRKAGVALTKEQEKQIKTLVETNRLHEAQALVLDMVAKKTEGAALASQGPYHRAMNILADVTEDASKALAIGFMPVLTKAADRLSTALANPQVMANIEGFGRTLADAFDSALTIAERLPWGTIGASLQLAGAGAKAILGAFTSMPPWVQTAVITGWGLNKLTGGALGKIGVELVGGVLKRGATPATPMFTKEVGLPGGGGPGGAAGKVGGIGALGMGALVAEAAVLAAAVYATYSKIGGDLNRQAQGVQGKTASFVGQATPAELRRSLDGLLKQQRDLNGDLVKSIASTIFPQGRDQLADSIAQLTAAIEADAAEVTAAQSDFEIPPQRLSAQAEGVLRRAVEAGLDPSQRAVQRTLERNLERTREAAEASRKVAAAVAIAERARSIQQSIANIQLMAIARKEMRPVVNVNTGFDVTLSVRDTVVKTAVRQSYGTIASGNRRGVS